MGLIESMSVPEMNSALLPSAQWDVNGAVVWLRGEHDTSTRAALDTAISQAIAHDGAGLILDLSELCFIDAATIGTIVQTCERLRHQSRSLELRSPSPWVISILDLCGLSRLVDSNAIEVGNEPSRAPFLAG